jgi:hypothetical protein
MVELLVRVVQTYKLVIPDQQTAVIQLSQQSPHSAAVVVDKEALDMKLEVVEAVVVPGMTAQMPLQVPVRV